MSEANDSKRLTIDTNNVVSGTISPGNFASMLFPLWREEAFIWVQTPQTFNELSLVLQRPHFKTKYQFRKWDIEDLLNTIAAGATFVPPMPHEDLAIHSRDTKDDIFLSCAFAGDCDFLITGDDDLLVLNGEPELKKLQILTAEMYLKKIRKQPR